MNTQTSTTNAVQSFTYKLTEFNAYEELLTRYIERDAIVCDVEHVIAIWSDEGFFAESGRQMNSRDCAEVLKQFFANSKNR